MSLSTRSRRGLLALGLSLVIAAIGLASTDAKTLKRSWVMLTALKLNQVVEILSGPGALGVLADGGESEAVTLEDGTEVPRMTGIQPLHPHPLPPLPVPDHPFLLDENDSGGVHADSYNSSVSSLPGPLGRRPRATRVAVSEDEIAMCTPLLRDLEGRLASICISLRDESHLVLFDPEDDFRILARTLIPKRRGMLDPAGGWYSRMDEQGRPIVPTPRQDIRVFEAVQDDQGWEWRVAERYDLAGALPADVSANDVVPDWVGNYWFITGFGHVGYLNRQSGSVEAIELGDGDETIGAALTVGPDGAYVLTSAALYLVQAPDARTPSVTWRWVYGEAGSIDLSTPTLLDQGRLIAFGMDGLGDRGTLIVARTSASDLGDAREVCKMPLFEAGASSLKNTIIGYDRSLVVQNNAGGDFFEVGDFPPGLARVDVREDHSGCDLVWEELTVASQVPPRLSTGDGYVYQYSRRRGTADDTHAWYISAIDFRTGALVSEIFVGSGKQLDSPMLSSNFWPGNTYVGGVRNGLLFVRDTE